MRRALVTVKADKVAVFPGVLRGGPGDFCALWFGGYGLRGLLLIDIVERERETQAALCSSGSWGNLGL